MLARLRKTVEENEEGFTLIELLVVMIIIGILAAIAIPVFLNQRKKAVDSSMKSDLRTISTNMETMFQDNNSYLSGTSKKVDSTGSTLTLGGDKPVMVQLSNGNQATVYASTDKYCVKVSRIDGASAATQNWYWESDKGGMVNPNPNSIDTDCSAYAS